MRTTIDCSAEEITVGVTSHLAPGAPPRGGSEDRANDATAGQAGGAWDVATPTPIALGISLASYAGRGIEPLRGTYRAATVAADDSMLRRHLVAAFGPMTPSRLAPRARGRREGWRGPRCSASVFAIEVLLCPRWPACAKSWAR
jgi:hypothetical protein